MFGNHDYETAVKLAKEKTKELGKNCDVFPSEDEPGKFTIGVQITFLTGEEFKKRIIERYKGTEPVMLSAQSKRTKEVIRLERKVMDLTIDHGGDAEHPQVLRARKALSVAKTELKKEAQKS